MIGRIEGVVSHKDRTFLIVSAGGIGYKVHTPTQTLDTCREGKTVAFWTHLAVRENALDLYGFAASEERAWSTSTWRIALAATDRK